jgi:DNA-binding response OmpR family regulator
MGAPANRILIAEDHYVSRFLLERKLLGWGFDVLATEDGEAACKLLEGPEPPSIAVLDWNMPKMDGLEVCRRIRGLTGIPYIYLVLLTSKDEKDEIASALEAGFDDYVMKPFDSIELQARLRMGKRVVALEHALAEKAAALEQALADLAKLR